MTLQRTLAKTKPPINLNFYRAVGSKDLIATDLIRWIVNELKKSAVGTAHFVFNGLPAFLAC